MFFCQSTELLSTIELFNEKFEISIQKKGIEIYCTAHGLYEGGSLCGESLSDRIYILLFGFDFT